MADLFFPENLFIMHGLPPSSAAGGALVSQGISLKNVHKLWAVCGVHTPTSAAVAIVPQTDVTVAFAGAEALVHTVPIWVNLTADATDLFARATDAVNYTTAADALAKTIIFEIDPASIRTELTSGADEDCFRISFTAVAAGDWVDVIYIIQPRYPSAVANQTYIAN